MLSLGRGSLVMSLAAAMLCVACGGESPAGPSAPTPAPTPVPIARIGTSGGVRLEILEVRGNRWAQSGSYKYDVSYRVSHAQGRRMTIQVASHVVTTSSGETLAATANVSHLQPRTIEPGSSGRLDLTLDDTDISHPYGDRLRLVLSFTVEGAESGTVSAEDIILHPPQSARLHEFTVSPLDVRVSAQVIVRWRVESASHVLIESSVPWNGSLFTEVVDQEGSRTFTATRSGVAFVTIRLDQGTIARQQQLIVR